VGWLENGALMLREVFEPKPKHSFLVEMCVLLIVPHCDNGTANGEYTRASKFPKIIKKLFGNLF
jgi:hypothetical protein